ncbi:SPOR domain-containing protein [Streptomyces sp. NPDC047315]|uniref:SPOR domain-containing protein n=1 Tax=Streptomyces sp. NPDC047315 TaxID=3155142 RepID=UPI0033E100D5
MSDSTALTWLVIRQDDNGNRYRVGQYATEDEARRIAADLHVKGRGQLYHVERMGQSRH